MPSQPNCRRCVHYLVTWDERFPHGCRRMGFKSRTLPVEEVRRAMDGSPCRLYQPKPPRQGERA